MGAGLLTTDDLDDFVAEVDALGGLGTAGHRDFVADFDIDLRTDVDQDLDPYSPAYIEAQQSLYQELSGREIDQEQNEITALEPSELVGKANPYGSTDVMFIAEHARTILTSILVSQLPPAAKVLDMGCGWGLSTEMFAFTGCSVSALDINPLFIDLVAKRADIRGFDVETIRSSFDGVDVDDLFDLVFFYESLHHAILPWEVLGAVAPRVKPGGKITIAGEPINEHWWTNWGLRLDPDSVYCIRKFGWFESGWSEQFITDCFARVGFDLKLMPGIGLKQTTVGVATRVDDKVTGITAESVLPAPGQIVPDPETILGQLAKEVRQLTAVNEQLAHECHALGAKHSAVMDSRWMRLGQSIRELRR